jgi:DNA-binding CsgD family transcriptional regulator
MSVRSQASALPPLERERELAMLSEALTSLRDGDGPGRVVALEGPMGIGKSRLLAEARTIAAGLEIQVLHARAGELERDYPFGVVRRLFEDHLARVSDAERHRLVSGRAELAGGLLGGAGGPALATTTEQFELFNSLYWLTCGIADHAPLAVLVDDAHWADELSLRFLLHLGQRLDRQAIGLLVAARTSDAGALDGLVGRLMSSAGEPPHALAPLSHGAVQQLLQTLDLPELADEPFASAVHHTTGGNPFLVQALLAAIRSDPGSWSPGDIARLNLHAPDSVRRAVILRFTTLGADALALAKACAVYGDDTPVRRAALIAGLSLEEALHAADRLVDARILTGDHSLSFSEPMVRTAIHAELGGVERAHLHAATARLVYEDGESAPRVAHHLLASMPIGEPWAYEALHEAGRTAAHSGAPATAVQLLRGALALNPPVGSRASLLLDLGLVEAASGEALSLQHLDEALASLDGADAKAEALYALGQTLYRYGRHEEAAATFRQGADLMAGHIELVQTFDAAFMCAADKIPHVLSDADSRLEEYAIQLEDKEALTSAERVLLACLALRSAMRVIRDADEVAAITTRALGDGALLAEQSPESMVVYLAVEALIFAGRFEQAQETLDAAIAQARERGLALAYAEASMIRAILMYQRGHLSEAIADARASIEGMDLGWRAGGTAPYAVLIWCLLDQGELDRARDVMRRALEAAEAGTAVRATATERGLHNWFTFARGRYKLATGDPVEALRDFEAVGTLMHSFGRTNPALTPWRSYAAQAAAAADDVSRAKALVADELREARRFGATFAIGRAMRVAAAFEDRPTAIVRLTRAVELLDGTGAEFELATALIDLGSVLRREGQRANSREPLRRGLELAAECGSPALERHARDELHASGARPRRAPTTGVASLTPSELRVAQFAAAGQSNREIAEALFLSKNTVDWHLRNVYQKLDVNSRSDLQEALTADADS